MPMDALREKVWLAAEQIFFISEALGIDLALYVFA